jgi:subtilisin family serine protease
MNATPPTAHAAETVWVHGNPVHVPSGVWPKGNTPRVVLRLSGPVQAEWRRVLSDEALQVRSWCPPSGACVEFPPEYRQDPSRLADLGFVAGGRDYTEEMCQRFGDAGQRVAPSALPGNLVDIVCFDRDAATAVRRLLEDRRIEVLSAGTTKLRVQFDGDLATLRDLPGVKIVDLARLPTLLSAAELRGSVGLPSAAPNPWGLDGAGEVIAIADTGLDSGSATSGMHPDFAGRIRALEALPMNPSWAGFAVPRSDDAADRATGHGTHVAGLALGSGVASRGVHGGLAPASELVFLALEQQVDVVPAVASRLPSGFYLAGRPVDLRDLYRAGATHGATLHNVSWGDATQGAYSDDCFETDLYLREDPLAVIVCAAGNDGVDRDGNRHIDSGSLHAPACAKNTLAVGATEGPLVGRGSRATWGQLDPGIRRWPLPSDRSDPVSGESDRIAPMSSCGPTRDARTKPDLCAPGTNLVSTRSRATPYKGWGLADPLPLYMYDGGTSMAAPVVTGALALIRQAWRREWKKVRRTPTGPALKALALLACTPVRGRGSDAAGPFEAGFGRLDITRALPPSFNARPGWAVTLRDAATQRLDTGERRDAQVRLLRTSRLRAVLCWYDPPGERLVNDLDLSLLDPGFAVLARGSVNPARPSTEPDRSNPVECIDISGLPAGRYVLRTTGFNVMDGPQRFALAWAIETAAT